jgi:hypothetical protein
MSTKEKKTKSKKKSKSKKSTKKKAESRDYSINDNEDYTIVLKKDGETKAYYPLELIGVDPAPPMDARFVAIAHMLQDEVSFNTAIGRFREANGLTEENKIVPEGSDKE